MSSWNPQPSLFTELQKQEEGKATERELIVVPALEMPTILREKAHSWKHVSSASRPPARGLESGTAEAEAPGGEGYRQELRSSEQPKLGLWEAQSLLCSGGALLASWDMEGTVVQVQVALPWSPVTVQVAKGWSLAQRTVQPG